MIDPAPAAPADKAASAPASAVARNTDLLGLVASVWLFRAIRLVVLVGVVSLFLAAALLLCVAALETVRHLIEIALPGDGRPTTQQTLLASIKLLDLVLLATVLAVVAFGLYSLFIDPDLPLPAWLRTRDVEGLKAKLAGIVILMLAVLFLEEVIHWRSERDLLSFGVALAAMIAALSYFVRAKSDKD